MPLGLFLALAGGLVAPGFGRRHAQIGDRPPILGPPDFRILAEISDQNHLVHASRHRRSPLSKSLDWPNAHAVARAAGSRHRATLRPDPIRSPIPRARPIPGYPHIAFPGANVPVLFPYKPDPETIGGTDGAVAGFRHGLGTAEVPRVPENPKQIINLPRSHFVGECCIWETAFPVESGILRPNWIARRSRLNSNASGQSEANKNWRDTMKKILLGTVALVALGVAAPASAADLAARPYTKAPRR